VEKPVAIVGLGALGSALAGLLAAAGVPVVGVCRRAEHREKVSSHGLLLREDGKESRITLPVFQELPSGQAVALAVILVKSFDTEGAAQSLAGRIAPDTPVLTLQNGLGNAETLAAHLAPEQILAGTTTFAALREAPGVVRLTGRGECEIGAWRPGAERHLPRVKELLGRGGIPCRFSSNVPASLWRKLAVNAVINPLTALLRVRNGELLERGELEPLFAAVVEEVWRVAARHQVALPTPPELVAEVRRVCQLTADNQSSMLRDLAEGRRTEVDAISGAVARLGRERGALAPVNEALAALIRAASSLSQPKRERDQRLQ
jgi:2-dehydropantoate 2-reductase